MIGQKATGSSLRGAEGHSRGTRRAVVTVLNDFEPGRFGNELFFVTAKFEGENFIIVLLLRSQFWQWILYSILHISQTIFYYMLPTFDELLDLLVSYAISVAYYFYVF